MRPCPLLRKLPNIRLIVGAKFGRGGLGVLAAYSVGYIFEVVMAALRYMGLSPHTPKKEEGRPFGPPFSIAHINGFVNLDIDKSIGVDVSQYRTALRTVQVQDLFYINRRV